jgi:transposase-like protein
MQYFRKIYYKLLDKPILLLYIYIILLMQYIMKTKDTKGFRNLIDVAEHFSDSQKCIDYMKLMRWNNNPICPHCGNEKVYEYKNGRLFKCAKCRKQFTVKVGTIFEDSKIDLQKWLVAVYLITSHKKGISSLQLSRDISVTQKTAWFMLHRIRYAVRTKSFNEPLKNIVEADETYIGGKEKNKHQVKRISGTQGRSLDTKTAVFGMLERDGEVRTEKVNDVTSSTLGNILSTNVIKGSTIMTDEWKAYTKLHISYNHQVVKHNTGEYVIGDCHTNNIENFWSLLKRGIVGIYHWTSTKHIDRYLDEFEFRYNTRHNGEIERFDLYLQSISGRLKYNQLTQN